MVGVAEQILGGPAEVVGDGVVLSNSFEVDLNRKKLRISDKHMKMIDHLKWFLRMLQ